MKVYWYILSASRKANKIKPLRPTWLFRQKILSILVMQSHLFYLSTAGRMKASGTDDFDRSFR